MAPQTRVEFVILKLSYYPSLHPQCPKMKMCRKRRSPSGSMPQVSEWFDRIMTKEKSSIPSTVKVRYCEWNIASGNANLFTINGYRFNQILLILGEETIHWVYYRNMSQYRRVEGYCPLSVNYCSCCFNNQYLKIMESVKSCLMKHDIDLN
ncbi:uncharacterized protein LOC135961320 [Calliphora vicina]|uniref:uncharacterized protein LOC135961318 n=1 Tax=Calliphora vicina TaxID=7373 RepID=UPI00325AC323